MALENPIASSKSFSLYLSSRSSLTSAAFSPWVALRIIYKASVGAGIFTEKEASEFFKKGWELPIHTFAEWKKYGYSVKKGEHAALTVRLWRKRIAKLIEKDSGEEMEADSGYYMTTAHLFTGAQVEKIKTA